MIDAVGNVSSVLLIGGTSELGQAVLTRLTGPRLKRVVLAGRPSRELRAAAARVRACGVPNVEVLEFDATDPTGHPAVIEAAFTQGDIDVAIMAVGFAPAFDADRPDPGLAARCIEANLTGTVSCGLDIARRLRGQGHGTMVYFASAAPAGRTPTDFVFATSQAGVASFATGLSQWMRGSGARVVLVRLGHIPTKLGALTDSHLPLAEPADVAAAVADAIRGRRRSVTYVPANARRRALLRLPRGRKFRR